MQIAETFDVSTLAWIKGEIDETLKQARIALEAFVEDPSAASDQLQVFIALLHQVRGTLQMVELDGASRFAGEIESLAIFLLDGENAGKDESVFETLMRGVLQLPDYLESLQGNRRDSLLPLLPLVNEMRSARGERPLGESLFFKPNLDVPNSGLQKQSGKLSAVATKVLPYFQGALVRLFRDQTSAPALDALNKACLKLAGVSQSHALQQVFWVATALVEAIREQGLELNREVKQLLGKLEQLIRFVGHTEEESVNAENVRTVTRVLLFHIGHSSSNGPMVTTLRQAFDLDGLFGHQSTGLGGLNADLKRTVAADLMEELSRIKDTFDVFVRGSRDSAEALTPIGEGLRRLVDTLALLHQESLASAVGEQLAIMHRIQSGEIPPDDGTLMGIAGALLSVESALGDWGSRGPLERAEGDTAVDIAPEAEAEHARVVRQVMKEAKGDLVRIREIITNFLEQPGDKRQLAELPVLFHRVAGSLSMLSYRRAARVLLAGNAFVNEKIIERQELPLGDDLDRLADAVMSLEYFLEAFVDGRVHPWAVLDVAEQAVAALGYPVDDIRVETPSTDSAATLPSPSVEEETLIEVALEGEAEQLDSGAALESEWPAEAEPQLESVPDQSPEIAEPTIAAAVIDSDEEDELDDEILEVFLEEAREEVERIQRLLPVWEQQPGNEEVLKEYRRSFHTLKGSGRLVGAEALGEFAWAIESMLNRVIDGTVAPGPAMYAVLHGAEDAIPELVEHFKSGKLPGVDIARLAGAADALARGEQPQLDDDRAVDEVGAAATSEASETPLPEAAQPAILMDPELLEIYTKEATDHLKTIRGFVDVVREGGSRRPSEPLVRALHTLKGSSRIAGVTDIATVNAFLERYAKAIQSAHRELDEDGVSALEANGALVEAVLLHLGEPSTPMPDASELIARTEALCDSVRHLEGNASPEAGLAAWGELGTPDSSVEPSGAAFEPVERSEPVADDSVIGEGSAVEFELLELDADQAGEELFTFGEIGTTTAASESIDVPIEPIVLEGGAFHDDEPLAQDSNESIAVTELESIPLDGDVDEPPGPAGHTPAFAAGEFEELLEAAGLDEFDWQQGEDSAVAAPEPESEPSVSPTLALAGDLQPGIPAHDLDDETAELVDLFLEEGSELLDANEDALARWLQAPKDRESIAELQRQLHTLKGSARLAGITAIGDLSHHLESAFEALAEGRMRQSPELRAVVQEAHDRLVAMIEQVRQRQSIASADDLIARIQAAASFQGEATADQEAVSLPVVEVEPVADRTTGEDLVAAAQPEQESPAASGAASPPSVRAEAVADEYDAELIDLFLEEGSEILDASEETLQAWTENPDDKQLVQALQRQLHTLKGSARMAGVGAVGDLSHSLESSFEAILEGRLRRSNTLLRLVQLAHDRLSDMLVQVRDRLPVVGGDDLIAQIEQAGRGLPAGQSDESATASSTLPKPAAKPSVELPADKAARKEPGAAAGGHSDGSSAGATFAEQALVLADAFSSGLKAWQQSPGEAVRHARLAEVVGNYESLARADNIRNAADMAAVTGILLREVHDGHVLVSDELFGLLILVHERLAVLAEQYLRRLPLRSVQDLIDSIKELIARHGVGREREDDAESAVARLRGGARIQHEMVRVRRDLMDNLVNFAGEVSIYRSRVEQQMTSFRGNLDEMGETVERLREQLRKFDIETEAQISSRYQEVNDDAEFDPLEFDRFTTMQQLSRAMMESLNDIRSIEEILGDLAHESETLLLQQGRVNTELQESLMQTRMVQLVENAPRLRRVVRQTSAELGRKANLSFTGAEVEMDRRVVERLMAPLEHMLRNAVAHGIEGPEQRMAAGKDEVGSINIAMSREGSEVVVRVSDDGRGIDVAAVRRKAIERGLMEADARLDDYEVMQFILESGFSTATALTQVAGRGVGMDVVSSEIRQLGGALDIDSEAGQGTRFTIRLPLTLSVSRALLINLGDEIFAIPLLSVQGIERIDVQELDKLMQSENPQFEWLGEAYTLLNLRSVLGVPDSTEISAESTKRPLLLAQSGEHRVALMVDRIVGSREIVIKSLGPQLATMPSLSGATILSDGSVALILELPALIRKGLARRHMVDDEAIAAAAEARIPTVMIVDDSITVRAVTKRLLKRHNMNPIAAKDGVDALTLLDETIPDVMLLDIEMPRMDGFELATHIRNSERLKHIPIIMITSRTGDKHRQRAMDIGVNVYLGKPYGEAELLEQIERLIAAAD